MGSSLRGVYTFRVLALCIALIFAALAIGACGGDDDGGDEGTVAEATTETTGEEASSGELRPATLATNPFAGSAAAFIARDAGFMEEQGLELEEEFLAVPTDAVAAVVSGDKDFALVNTITLMNAANENIPIQVIAPGYFGSAEEQGFYVAEDSDIQSMGDLEGKKIGTAGRGNINEVALVAAAGDAGVDVSTLEFVEIPLANMAAALRDGQVDIGPMVEPFITIGTEGLREVQDDPYAAYGPEGQPLTYYITSNQLAEEDPEFVEAFVSAVNSAHELAGSDPQAIRDAVASYSEIEPDVLNEMSLPAFGTDLKRDNLESQAEVAFKYDYLEEKPDISKLFP